MLGSHRCARVIGGESRDSEMTANLYFCRAVMQAPVCHKLYKEKKESSLDADLFEAGILPTDGNNS